MKKVKKGKNAPEEVEELEEGQQPKKKRPLILLIIPPVVIAAAAVIIFFYVIRPRLNADADPEAEPSATVAPQPPELPTAIPIGDDVNIKGLALEADESGAQAERSKRVTYTYTNLNDAGKAAQTYVGQLSGESPAFSVVDEEFVRQREQPDYTSPEGMVLLARNAPEQAKKESAAPETKPPESAAPQGPEAELILGGKSGFDAGLLEPIPTPEPEPEPEPVSYVHTVRITWSPGMCVVTADEEEGKVTSPQNNTVPAGQALTIRGAANRLREMAPAKLGLEGESMDEYELIPMDATEMVDGAACIRVNVYNGINMADSNKYRGSYLMSIDGLHLYQLEDGAVVELEGYP